ncbi:MAG: hypothetical protein B6D72_04110 [gamma proteobacterium symbiont of Ctena orbiculata]|uniref:DUF2007 domain-containing protein n=1 Tax=Candidatus Thiodiazotropha taylori TaxID=2792791 RepID=A0A944MBQ2_9GAMM|nr:DUF2007 domain-containing protein [Candidatus Thiodiazotropha taylori]PUB85508.1 MAG: hypothetical protein DBP00_12895 [gamma proteobacterium symbiont of Ctena orbiculata]MBT2990929.1 DUF2007 domain-containing protein [Candidatus Thiodiazotropha taylori]MBT2998690.1 DUF2007 domain-containing protein [Candidatus Thiodiazotropha taylori]MBT3002804.1 DUF2007 domain-containing protein [Candidatus Thiodiazotropha taylori]
MRELYQAADRVEAQVLKDYLDREGVETVIIGDHLSGAVGELPADIFPTLWVLDENDLERAKRLTERFFNRPPVSGTAWRCAVCGERIEPGFEVCWNCGSPNPNDNE